MDVLSQWQGFYNDPWFWQFRFGSSQWRRWRLVWRHFWPWRLHGRLSLGEILSHYANTRFNQNPLRWRGFCCPPSAVLWSTILSWPQYWSSFGLCLSWQACIMARTFTWSMGDTTANWRRRRTYRLWYSMASGAFISRLWGASLSRLSSCQIQRQLRGVFTVFG